MMLYMRNGKLEAVAQVHATKVAGRWQVADYTIASVDAAGNWVRAQQYRYSHFSNAANRGSKRGALGNMLASLGRCVAPTVLYALDTTIYNPSGCITDQAHMFACDNSIDPGSVCMDYGEWYEKSLIDCGYVINNPVPFIGGGTLPTVSIDWTCTTVWYSLPIYGNDPVTGEQYYLGDGGYSGTTCIEHYST